MRLPVLDDRLSRAAALFPACAYGADIGADHGRLSCILLARGVCRRMCVADISTDSLEKAKALLKKHGLIDRADLVVGDGLAALPSPAQAIAILGMGGRTLKEILLTGRDRLNGAALILSAHTDLPLLRQAVSDVGYHIEAEQIARAGGRYYVLLRALPGGESCTEKQWLLGPRLMEGCVEHYADYLRWRLAAAQCRRGEEAEKEIEWLKEEADRVRDCENDRGDAE